MGWQFHVSLLLAAIIILPIIPADGYQSETEDQQYGQLLDVRTFSSSCLLNETCEIEQPKHLVEYYSADWCEPCAQVSQQVNALNRTDVLVLQHHPSTKDASFLSASKLRFDLEFRLLLYPSLVVDGQFLLTGTRQAMDLNMTLSNSSEEFAGLSSLAVSNGTMHWNSSEETVLRMWYVEPIAHSSENRIHPHLAQQSWEFNSTISQHNLSDITVDEQGTFVVMLERPGTRLLTVSSAPTGRMELSEQDDNPFISGASFDPKLTVLIAIAGLLVILSPALIMQRNLMKKPIEAPEFEEE